MGHTIKALNAVGGWKRDSPGKRDGEDTELMKRFEIKYGQSITYTEDITCIYYARAACIIDDNEYKNMLIIMKKDQVLGKFYEKSINYRNNRARWQLFV